MSLQCWLFRSFVFLLAIIGWSVDFESALRAVGGAPSKGLLERIASSVLTFQVVTSVRSAVHQESRRFPTRRFEKRAIGTSLVVLVSLMFGFSPTTQAGPRHGNGWVIAECPSHGLHAGQIVEFDGHRLLCDSPTACGSTCPTFLYDRASSFTTAPELVATEGGAEVGTEVKGPADSPVWGETEPARGKTRTNGERGKAKEYYEWDYTHNDIEVYDGKGRHKGSKDPTTGEMTKPPVKGRRINV